MASVSNVTGMALERAKLIVQPIHFKCFGTNHPWIGLAIIHAPPSILRVFPTSFEFFGCHNISPR